MATKGYIGLVRDTALKDIKRTNKQIAAALGIEPPNLDLNFRDPDLLSAEELKVIAAFHAQVVAALSEREDAVEVERLTAELDGLKDVQQQHVEAQAEIERLTAELEAARQSTENEPLKDDESEPDETSEGASGKTKGKAKSE